MKYIIFDLDDTLLTSDRKISDYTYDVLKILQKQGHILVMNTARSFAYSMKHIERLEPNYAITNGGAQIVNQNLETIYQKFIAAETTNALIKDLLQFVTNISVDTDQGFFTSDPHYHSQNAIYFDFNQDFTIPAGKLVVQSSDANKIMNLAKQYQLEHSQYLNGDWHRISPLGCSKWNGVLALLNITQGKIEDTITFGDDIGDLEMLEKAGVGVAMANSIPQILKIIPRITLSNNQDGVARFLVKYFKLNYEKN